MFYKKNSMGDNVVDEKKLKDFASNLRNLVGRREGRGAGLRVGGGNELE